MTNQNVLGGPLTDCGHDPLTGFFRDGCCRTDVADRSSHTVCARLTEAFLSYSFTRGNDLITARPEFGFPGLKPGDRWCLCASRWEEARLAGCAPPVDLGATHKRALDAITRENLKAHAEETTP
ncbi:MAG: DUF2237 domain-containing protein [Pseudomonadota bacterium]